LDDEALALGQARQHLPRICRGSCLSALRGRERLGVVVDVHMVPEAPSAQMVDQLVTGDSMQPRFQRLGVVPAVALQMHDQQCLLHDVLTVFHGTPRSYQPAPGRAAQPDRDAAQQRPIGLVVAAAGQPHQPGEIVGIGQGARSLRLSVRIAETLQATRRDNHRTSGDQRKNKARRGVTFASVQPNDVEASAQPSRIRRLILNKRMMITTAASIFAATTFVSTAAFADGVKCGGTNSCKGQSACKSAANSCKGQNACKGQGFTEASTSAECGQKGGKVL
jgi:hypothetical protein